MCGVHLFCLFVCSHNLSCVCSLWFCVFDLCSSFSLCSFSSSSSSSASFFCAYKKHIHLLITHRPTLVFTRPSSSWLLFWIIESAPLSLCHQSSDHPIFFFPSFFSFSSSSSFSSLYSLCRVRDVWLFLCFPLPVRKALSGA